MPDSIAIWQFPSEADYELMVKVALDLIEEPDARGVLVSSRGDVITLQLTTGKFSGDPDSRFCVERRGGFVLPRRKEWPARPVGDRPRVLLTFRAWPLRE